MRLPGGRRRRPQPLFEHWDEIARRLRAAGQIRLFLDFDGTLVAYQPTPEGVTLSAATGQALRRLAAHRRVRAAIVSGRGRRNLSEHIKIPGLMLLGLYGWDDGKRGKLAPRTLGKLERARRLLSALQRLSGVFLEDKEISLTVHFREAGAATRRRTQARVRRILPQLGPELHLIAGHSTWELAPRQVRGKGSALREHLRGARRPYLPIYLGDDLTDESAFAALRRGITVLVGPPRRSHARYRLADSREVGTFLERLAAELS